MIVFDTNILIRMFINDEPHQFAEVKRFIERALEVDVFFVSMVTLAELVWALRMKKLTRAEITAILEEIVNSDSIVIGQRQAVTQALAWYKSGKADFADYLIHADGMVAGAKTLVTFDEAFASEDKKRRKHPRQWKSA